jgi:hypothetical protein
MIESTQASRDNLKKFFFVGTCLYVFLNPANIPAWDAGPKDCKHDVCSGRDWRGNTHLWVVDRAIDLLAKSDDPIARKAIARMNKKGSNACRAQWESGLWDTDDGFLAENFGSSQRLGTHFYNPTGIDAWGQPTEIRTYTLIAGPARNVGQKIYFGDARLNARYRLAAMLRRPGDNLPETNGSFPGDTSRLPESEKVLSDKNLLEMTLKPYYPGALGDDTQAGDERCYDLGTALHYLTDITEPFHASGYDVFKYPTMLHAVYEDYVPRIQKNFPIGAAVWEKRYVGNGVMPASADQVFDSVARASNALAPPLLKTIMETGGTCTYTPEAGTTFTGPCFLTDAGRKAVDAQTGIVLATAYQSVASYLWAVFNDDYLKSQAGKSCPAGTQLSSNNLCFMECKIGYTTFGTRCREDCPKDGCRSPAGTRYSPKIYTRLQIKAD